VVSAVDEQGFFFPGTRDRNFPLSEIFRFSRLLWQRICYPFGGMKSDIKGLLIDLDGVLYVGGEAIPGAREALDRLGETGIARRFVTNTTTRTAGEVAAKLADLGFQVELEEIFSPVVATRRFLERHEGSAPSVHLLVRDSILPEFEDFPRDRAEPDYVIVGDIGAAWSYQLMNTAFRQLMKGAELIAMHRNKFFETEEGLHLDIGAFVAGLEYVTGNSARIIGKPSPDFFDLGIQSLGLPPEQIAMVGDDVDSDVGGGQAVGLNGVLVRTGKFRQGYVEESGVEPEAILDSIAGLPAWCKGG